MSESIWCLNKQCIWITMVIYLVVFLFTLFNLGIEPLILPAGNQLARNFELVKTFDPNQTDCNFYGIDCQEIINNQCIMNNLCFNSNNSYINKTLYDSQNIGGVALMNSKGYYAIKTTSILTLLMFLSFLVLATYKCCKKDNSCEIKNRDSCKLKCLCFNRKLTFPMFLHINLFLVSLVIFLFITPAYKWMEAEKKKDWIITSDSFLDTRFSSEGYESSCPNNLYIIDPYKKVSDQCYEVDDFGDQICCINNLVDLNDDANVIYPTIVKYTEYLNRFSYFTIHASGIILFLIFFIPFVTDLFIFFINLYDAYKNRVIESHIYYSAMEDEGVELQTSQV